jgi:hypothetical protein
VVHRTGHLFPTFYGPKSTLPHVFEMVSYGAGALYSAMESVAGTDEDLGNNPPQTTLCRTVRSDKRTVRLRARTVRPCGRTVRRCMRTVRLGSLGLTWHMVARTHVSVIH